MLHKFSNWQCVSFHLTAVPSTCTGIYNINLLTVIVSTSHWLVDGADKAMNNLQHCSIFIIMMYAVNYLIQVYICTDNLELHSFILSKHFGDVLLPMPLYTNIACLKYFKLYVTIIERERERVVLQRNVHVYEYY